LQPDSAGTHFLGLFTCSVEMRRPLIETGMSAPTSAFVSSGVATTASSLQAGESNSICRVHGGVGGANVQLSAPLG